MIYQTVDFKYNSLSDAGLETLNTTKIGYYVFFDIYDYLTFSSFYFRKYEQLNRN